MCQIVAQDWKKFKSHRKEFNIYCIWFFKWAFFSQCVQSLWCMRTFLIRYERNAMKISRHLNISSHDVLNIREFNEEWNICWFNDYTCCISRKWMYIWFFLNISTSKIVLLEFLSLHALMIYWNYFHVFSIFMVTSSNHCYLCT